MKRNLFLKLFLFNLTVAIFYRLSMLQMSSYPSDVTTIPNFAAIYFFLELFLIYGGHVLFGTIVAYRYTKRVHPKGREVLQLIIFAFVNAFLIYLFRDLRYSSANIVIPFLPAVMQAFGVTFGHGLREIIESCNPKYNKKP